MGRLHTNASFWETVAVEKYCLESIAESKYGRSAERRAHNSPTVEAGGSMLSEWKAGLHFLWSRRPLFILIVQVAVFGFLITALMLNHALCAGANGECANVGHSNRNLERRRVSWCHCDWCMEATLPTYSSAAGVPATPR